MEAKAEGNLIFMKAADGEDLFEAIRNCIDDFEVWSGTIVMGLGMLRDANINFWNGEKYVEKQYYKPMELLTLSGSISTDGAFHLHASLALKDHSSIGGHLSEAIVNNLVELTIIKFSEIKIGRRFNPDTGATETTIT